MADPIQEAQPITAAPASTKWSWLTLENIKWIIIIVLGLILAGGGYSLKKTKEELLTEKANTKNLTEQLKTNSTTITDKKPIFIGGKIAYETTSKTTKNSSLNRTDNTTSLDLTDKKKETTTVKSSFGIGGAISTKGNYGVAVSSDVLYIGLGTLRAGTIISKDEQWGLAELNIYF